MEPSGTPWDRALHRADSAEALLVAGRAGRPGVGRERQAVVDAEGDDGGEAVDDLGKGVDHSQDSWCSHSLGLRHHTEDQGGNHEWRLGTGR